MGELLTVLAVIAVLTAILLPVLSSARSAAHVDTCLSNEHHLGTAMIQYVGENEDRFPATATLSPGGDWGDLIRPSTPSKAEFRCPSDPTRLPGEWRDGGIPQTIVSYGLNSNLASVDLSWLPSGASRGFHREGASHATLASPARTTMFFEVQGAVVDLKNVEKRRADGLRLKDDWPTGNTATGVRPIGDESQDYPNGVGIGGLIEPPLYAIGSVGGRVLNGGKAAAPRHAGRSVYLACDGHTIALRPEQVSGGADAEEGSCEQGTFAGQSGACAGQRRGSAAGTAQSRYAMTFSTR